MLAGLASVALLLSSLGGISATSLPLRRETLDEAGESCTLALKELSLRGDIDGLADDQRSMLRSSCIRSRQERWPVSSPMTD